MKRIISLAMLVMLMVSTFVLSLGVQPAKASGTIHIGADGSIDPPSAPISTLDNVTYTVTGNITGDADGILVERDNIIIDGAGYTIQGAGSGTGIYLSGRSNVTIKNTNTKRFGNGIVLQGSNNNSISRNNITEIYWIGIYSSSLSSNNIFSGNNIAFNGYGISLSSSSNNIVSKNTVTNNGLYGITLADDISINNTISENTMTNNNYNIYFVGGFNNTISRNNIANNTYGTFLLSSNNAISENNITNNGYGIYLVSSSNSSVGGNNVTNNSIGIEFISSSNNSLGGNNISNNNNGVMLSDSSSTSISGNNIATNGNQGLVLDDCSNMSVSGNNITANHYEGISLGNSLNNSISGNNIADNMNGISLSSSLNNSIFDNNITNNKCGVVNWANNTFYHNNFLNNGVPPFLGQVLSFGMVNVWDDGYPSGGNYWSDYAGVDANGDGIGDIPYVIDADNQDRYPLMHLWSSLPVHNINTGLGYATIQGAIDASETLNGHTIFVEAGTYNENVKVYKSLNIMGEGPSSTVLNACYSSDDAFQVTSDFTDISGFTVQGAALFKAGIILQDVDGCSVSNNGVTGNSFGIYLVSSANNEISNNHVSLNEGFGIALWDSSNNTVISNDVSSSTYGVRLDLGSNNTIVRNKLNSNSIGIHLISSHANKMADNDASDNSYCGMALETSDNNSVVANNASSNSVVGIILAGSKNNNVEENIASQNNLDLWNSYGISIYFGSSNNTIRHNIISTNMNGILLLESSGNNILENDLVSNLNYAIRTERTNGNSIYHNNFIDNIGQVYDWEQQSMNVWDNGYPSGGNYWSDYVSLDVKSGPGQDSLGSDSIGDTAYIIDANNQDNYPLMNPYGSVRTITATIDIDPYTLNLKSKGNWITAHIELPKGYDVSDINVSTVMLNVTVPAELSPTAIDDHDDDSVPDLMVKFNMTAVSEFMLSKGIKYGNVTLTITGKLNDGTVFDGSDIIRVRMPGDINCDGKVDVRDVAPASLAFGSYIGHPRWNPDADENEDGRIDVRDIALIARNFGISYK
jgi:parallel beta-helix repeat protein